MPISYPFLGPPTTLGVKSQQTEAVRDKLQVESFTELNSFTGSDIKAFILLDGDRAALNAALDYIDSLARAIEELGDQGLSEADARALSEQSLSSESIKVTATGGEGTDTLDNAIYPLVHLHTITISTFRNKKQARALGHVNPRGYARGSRTIAGTFVLIEFDKDPFWQLLAAPSLDTNIGDTGPVLPDQMRPFDIVLLFASELGSLALRHIYGVELVTNGTVYSIQDMYTENTLSYVARDVSPLIPLSEGSPQIRRFRNLVTESLASENYRSLARLKASRSPFI